jgi:hypothetical protein
MDLDTQKTGSREINAFQHVLLRRRKDIHVSKRPSLMLLKEAADASARHPIGDMFWISSIFRSCHGGSGATFGKNRRDKRFRCARRSKNLVP